MISVSSWQTLLLAWIVRMSKLWPWSLSKKWVANVPIGSMYGRFTCICHKNQLNVGTYTIHEGYGVAR